MLKKTNAALNNPLIDEYSLKGAKGLLVNITGGNDLTLFEVDEAVNKIRAEVDPEAELIFGSIEDEKLNGKIRVSIVATSLDGQEPETKPVISMVHRLHNRGVSNFENQINTFTTNQSTLNATEGATALDMNVAVEKDNVVQQKAESEQIENENKESLPQDISIENASYLQSMEDISTDKNYKENDEVPTFEVDSIELATPELFSDNNLNDSFNQENNIQEEPVIFENAKSNEVISTKEPEMFEDTNSEENFEIPAFLRRQKN